MGIQFEEESGFARKASAKKSGGVSGLIIGMGLAKDDAGAQVVMLIIAIASIALAAYLVISSGLVGELPAPVPTSAWPK